MIEEGASVTSGQCSVSVVVGSKGATTLLVTTWKGSVSVNVGVNLQQYREISNISTPKNPPKRVQTGPKSLHMLYVSLRRRW